MNLEPLRTTTRNFARIVKRNSPMILTAIGVTGFVATVVMTVKTTPKVIDILEEVKDKDNVEKFKATAPLVIAPAVVGLGSIACIVLANRISYKRGVTLAASYSLLETALEDYQDNVIELFGKKKHEEILDKRAENYLQKNPVGENTIFFTDRGDTLMYESLSGRYFRGDIEKIRQAQNNFNERMFVSDNCAALNELYYDMGLEAIDIGDILGWNVTRTVDFRFTSKLAANNEPCLVIDYLTPPIPDYDVWM